MSDDGHEDFSQPVLAGTARSDYERYLNTEELLSLQKTAAEWVHRDELLFQTVLQSSELWQARNELTALSKTSPAPPA